MSNTFDPQQVRKISGFVEVSPAVSDRFAAGMVVHLGHGQWFAGTGPNSDTAWARREIARVIRGSVRRLLGALR